LDFYGIEIEPKELKSVYPSAFIEYDGDRSEMSLEWTEANESSVKILSYILTLDSQKVEFKTKDELFIAISDIYAILNP